MLQCCRQKRHLATGGECMYEYRKQLRRTGPCAHSAWQVFNAAGLMGTSVDACEFKLLRGTWRYQRRRRSSLSNSKACTQTLAWWVVVTPWLIAKVTSSIPATWSCQSGQGTALKGTRADRKVRESFPIRAQANSLFRIASWNPRAQQAGPRQS